MAEVGEKIKKLRRGMGVTQVRLAEELGVTPQAVSKWENGTSLPDTELLPEIAAYFGITIDSLFDYSKEKEYRRIEHMLEYGTMVKNEDFLKAERFLLSEAEEDPENYDAVHLLADVYWDRAEVMEKKAIEYAKRALRLKPGEKADMSIISHCGHGKMYDWNIANHRELIDYWRSLIREDPANRRAYLYLLDDLIDDRRLKEAREVLEEARSTGEDTLYEAYEIWIDETEQGFDSVKDRYRELASKYENDWRVLFNVANAFST